MLTLADILMVKVELPLQVSSMEFAKKSFKCIHIFKRKGNVCLTNLLSSWCFACCIKTTNGPTH